MTRVLSELLGAHEPLFQLHLQQLERVAGRPNADIRLTVDVQNSLRAKLHALHLSPENTTGQELYAALGGRIQADEERFMAAIAATAARKKDAGDVVGQVTFRLGQEFKGVSCFALKSTVAKRLLKANVPKKTMKLLGYRSVESLFKHEPVASLYAAAWLVESEQWAKKVVGAYAKLKASDFEVRPLNLEHPTSKRWQTFSESVISEKRQHVLVFKELGAVVLLPLPANQPAAPALSTAVLTIHAINDILAASAYLKLHQVQPSFGTAVRKIVLHEAVLETRLLDRPVSWNLMQQYYARFKTVVKTDVFEPLVQADDLAWHSAEDVLCRIEPTLEFWRGTPHVGLLDAAQTVSCNVTDVILNHCSNVPYASRLAGHFREHLMTELLLRYMGHEHVEQAISGQLQRQLAYEPVAA